MIRILIAALIALASATACLAQGAPAVYVDTSGNLIVRGVGIIGQFTGGVYTSTPSAMTASGLVTGGTLKSNNTLVMPVGGYICFWGGIFCDNTRNAIYGDYGSTIVNNPNSTSVVALALGNVQKIKLDGTANTFTVTPPALLNGGAILGASTVSGLPTCNTGTRDLLRVVTDASSPTYGGTLTGGGSTRTLAYCTGSAWTAH